jgi:hypothetical protein
VCGRECESHRSFDFGGCGSCGGQYEIRLAPIAAVA